MSTVPSPDFIAQWNQYATQLPAGAPDALYDAQREKFFEQAVRPWGMAQGANLPALQEEFMRKTGRMDKSPAPRTAVAAKTAINSLMGPVLGALDARDAQKALAGEVQASKLEAERQGAGTALPEMAGSIVGTLPYFVPAFRAAEAIATAPRLAAAMKSVQGLQQSAEFGASVAAGAAAESTMSAMRAEDGHRVSAGVEGAVVGGATVAALGGGILGVRAALARKGVTGEAAKAVEATIQGNATAEQEAVGSNIISQDSSIVPDVVQASVGKVQAAAKAGVPKKAPQVRKTKGVEVQAEGDPAPTTIPANDPNFDAKLDELLQIARKQSREAKQREHFENEQRRALEAVNGDPKDVHRVLTRVDQANADEGLYDTPVVLRGSSEEESVVHRAQATPSAPSSPAGEVATPTASPVSLPAVEAKPIEVTPAEDFVPRTAEERQAFAKWKAGELTDNQFAAIIEKTTPKVPITTGTTSGEMVPYKSPTQYTAEDKLLDMAKIAKAEGSEFTFIRQAVEQATGLSPVKSLMQIEALLGEDSHTTIRRSSPKQLADLVPQIIEKASEIQEMKSKILSRDVTPTLRSTLPFEAAGDAQTQAKFAKARAMRANATSKAGATKIGMDQVPKFDWLKKLPSGEVYDAESGEIFPSALDALASRGGRFALSRRDMLKQTGGAVAGAGMSAPQVEALTKAAGAGSEGAVALLNRLWNGFAGGGEELSFVTPEVIKITGDKGSIYRGLWDFIDIVRNGGQDYRGPLYMLGGWAEGDVKLSKPVIEEMFKEVREASPRTMREWLNEVSGFSEFDDMKLFDKIQPGLKEKVLKLQELDHPSLDELERTGKKLGELKPKDIDEAAARVEEQRTKLQKEQVQERYTQQQAAIRPTGMELARTHAPLGEEGQGGVLTRYTLNDRINEKNTVYHFTDTKGLGGILKLGEIKPSTDEEGRVLGAWVTRDPGRAHTVGGGEYPEGKSIAVVLDRSKVRSTPEDNWYLKGEEVDEGANISQASEITGRGIPAEAIKGVVIDPSVPGRTRSRLVAALQERGIPFRVEAIEDMTTSRARFAEGQRFSLGAEPPERMADGSVFAERPLYRRFTGDPLLEGGADAATAVGEGVKPTIFYRDEAGKVSPEVAYHEAMHSHIGYLGMNDRFAAAEDPMFAKLHNAFDPEVRSGYMRLSPDAMNEEVFTWLSQAVRHGDEGLINSFAEADGGRSGLLEWYGNTLDSIRADLASKSPSLHRNVMERKILDLQRRATRSLEDISRESTDPVGDSIRLRDDGKYTIERADGSTSVFATRQALADQLEREYSPPMNAPELIDTSLLPEGVERYALSSKAAAPSPKAPIHTTPPDPSLMPGDAPIKAGIELGSFFIRPFYAWVDSVAQKHNWPALSESMGLVKDAEVAMNRFMDPYRRVLGDTIQKYGKTRRKDLYRYLEASDDARANIETELRITPQEKADLDRLDREFFIPLAAELGVDGKQFIREFQPRWRLDSFSLDKLGPRKSDAATSSFEFFSEAVRNAEIDPRDTDLLRVAHEYMRLGARKRFLEGPINSASELINLKDAGKNYIAGNLQPLLKRHLDYMRGVPDYTQRIMHGALESAMNTINEGVRAFNKKMPERMQIGEFELTSRDAFNKWISYSYAGALMLRPMVPIRDSLQLLLTTYPVLGAEYMMKGISKAFEMRQGKVDSETFQVPLRYGAMIRHNDLLRYLEGDEKVSANRFVEQAMRVLEYSNNSNRLVSFWGHALRVQDALRKGVDASFGERSGLSYLEKGLRENYLNEARSLSPDGFADFSYRASKDLVDLSQWNYSRGASPGLYKFGLGKVFGQYGTWPLNYIEYARRITLGDGQSTGMKVGTLTRLALAHGAILKAGEAVGVDTGSWVFTNPMAYGGGPMFQSLLHIPGSMDFETRQGAEARRAVIRPFFPMGIPGGLAAEQIWKAVTSNDPDVWKVVMGFHPMRGKESERGMHLLPPNLKP